MRWVSAPPRSFTSRARASSSRDIPADIIGHHFYEEDLTLVEPLQIDGVARLPEGPGLGVELTGDIRRTFSA